MIVLFTDFGVQGPYVGQMEAVIKQLRPDEPVIHLLHNAPVSNPYLSAYLLAALKAYFNPGTVFLCVIDPGVGGDRAGVVVEADGQFFVGPDNGLFNTVAKLAEHCQWHKIHWQPEKCSRSFHGRDWFAPVAVRVTVGDFGGLSPFRNPGLEKWLTDINKIIYFDHYGNAMTGLRYQSEMDGRVIKVNGQSIKQSDTFCSVAEGEPFWYRNSIDLVEIAVNQGCANLALELLLGQEFEVL